MIDPDLHTFDLEPDGFAWWSALAGRLLYRDVDEIQVLHRSGLVLQFARTSRGKVPAVASPIADAHAAATALRAATGADRVTFIEADGLRDLARSIDASAASDLGQVELMAHAEQAWATHPAIVSDPPRMVARWPAVAQVLATSAPPNSCSVLGAWRDDELVASLVAVWGRRGIVRLTSADHLGVRPTRGHASELINAVEAQLGPVVHALLADAELFEAVAGAENPWDALARAVGSDTVIAASGLEALVGS